MFLDNRDSQLVSIKFLDAQSKVLLSAGGIEDDYLDEDDPRFEQFKQLHEEHGGRMLRYFDYAVKHEFSLAENERLVGVKGGSKNLKQAVWFDVQFIIGRPE